MAENKVGSMLQKKPYYLKALNIAKATKSRELDKETYDTLERANTDLWNRIIKDPNGYVMTRDEYNLLKYYSTRYENNTVAKRAIARFWEHYNSHPGDPNSWRSTRGTQRKPTSTGSHSERQRDNSQMIDLYLASSSSADEEKFVEEKKLDRRVSQRDDSSLSVKSRSDTKTEGPSRMSESAPLDEKFATQTSREKEDGELSEKLAMQKLDDKDQEGFHPGGNTIPNQNVMCEMVRATGLPKEIWTDYGAERDPGSEDLRDHRKFELDERANLTDPYPQLRMHHTIRCRRKISEALEKLPASHILGQALLLRPLKDLTTMVTIAEGTIATFGTDLAELLWVIIRSLELAIRDPRREGWYKYSCTETSAKFGQIESLSSEPVSSSQLTDSTTNEPGLTETKRDKHRESHKFGRFVDQHPTSTEGQFKGKGSRKQVPLDQVTLHRCRWMKYRGYPHWYLHSSPTHHSNITSLLDWLATALGDSTAPDKYFDTISLASESRTYSLADSSYSQGCWRQKLRGGNILTANAIRSKSTPTKPTCLQEISADFPDSLILTSAALWSLFDNELEEIPGCRCTLRAPGETYLQCTGTWRKWYLWHFETQSTGGKPPCSSDTCWSTGDLPWDEQQNRMAVSPAMPCILGWKVESRTRPNEPLWTSLTLSGNFKQKEIGTFSLHEIQAQIQLIAPLSVSPQFGGAATFRKTHYRVAQSMDHDSHLASEAMAVATVLIYDESRQVHLLSEGSDIIELLCVNYLRNLGLSDQIDEREVFTHKTSRERLNTWHDSNFQALTGRLITGDRMVRQATKVVSQLFEKIQEMPATSRPCWPLENVLKGGLMTPYKRPSCKTASWEALMEKSRPLILAVGSIHHNLIDADGPFQTTKSRARTNTFRRFVSDAEPAGLIADYPRMDLWLQRVALIQEFRLHRTNARFKLKTNMVRTEPIWEVRRKDETGLFHLPLQGDTCRLCSSGLDTCCVHLIL